MNTLLLGIMLMGGAYSAQYNNDSQRESGEVNESWRILVSAGSITVHHTSNEYAEKNMPRNVGKGITLHPGVYAAASKGHYDVKAWYFSDSFGNHAGGILNGLGWDWGARFRTGIQAGVYVREEVPSNINGGFMSRKVGGVEIVPMVGVSQDIRVASFGKADAVVSCLQAIILTNCTAGIRW